MRDVLLTSILINDRIARRLITPLAAYSFNIVSLMARYARGKSRRLEQRIFSCSFNSSAPSVLVISSGLAVLRVEMVGVDEMAEDPAAGLVAAVVGGARDDCANGCRSGVEAGDIEGGVSSRIEADRLAGGLSR